MRARTCLIAFAVFASFTAFAQPVRAAYTPAATKSAELSVSASILPKPEDFQFAFSSNLTGAATADQEIEYTISYGSKIDYGTPMVIEAEWSLGSVTEEYLYNYEIVSYIPGSATRDYWGESTPVVDIKHRKITWTITRFPPNTLDKTLRFKLKTPGRYVTDRQVAFSVTARMRTNQIGVGEITLDQLYNPTEFIRREVRGMQILSADVRKITDTSFTLYLVTSVPVLATIFYGTDADNLTETVTDSLLSDTKTIEIGGLTPATTYFFRILIENDKGIQRKTPELFTITTAAHSLLSLIDQDRMVVTARGVSLKPEFGRGGSSILVPRGTDLDFYIPFLSVPPNRVYLSVSGLNVLGATTAITLPGMQKIRLLETQYKVFTGRLPVPVSPGTYDVFIETDDDSGTINQDTLFTATISRPLTVTDSRNRPVEKALVYIERYSNDTNDYERFPSESYGSHNPAYTNPDGTLDVILPDGEYTFTVNAVGFAPAETKFTMLPGSREQYPTIMLSRSPFALRPFAVYYLTALADFLQRVNALVREIASSGRFLDLGFVTGVIILTIISSVLNLKRIKLTGESAYIFLEKWLRRTFFHERTVTLLIGFVEDAQRGLPVHGAAVYLLEHGTRNIVSRDLSSPLGEFRLRFTPGRAYDMVVKKPGFMHFFREITADELLEELPPASLISETRIRLSPAIEYARELAVTLFHGLTDMLILGVAILSVWMTARIGVLKMLPILIVTTINLAMWFEYHLARFHRRSLLRRASDNMRG